MIVTLSDLTQEAERLLAGTPEGDGLDEAAAALIDVAVKAAVSSLDVGALEAAIQRALEAGAQPCQVQEIIALISGLGVHSMMISANTILGHAAVADPALLGPLDEAARTLWAHHVGDDPFWQSFNAEFPGFLDALLRLSPAMFRQFHDYCAVPWESGTVRAVTKELASMASDATPTHRFLPGFRFHLKNALKLGAGRAAIQQALAIAAAAPLHSGVA